MLRDNHWYNANSQRPWPLDDSALLQADDGQRIPQNVLVDLQLRFPASYGNTAYLGSLYCGPAAVAVLILSENGDLLASLSLARSAPLEPGRIYDLTPAAAGIGGWVVFGDGAEELTSLRLTFSSANQSRLLPQLARSYAEPPIRSLARLGASQSLTGVVRLVGGPDIEVVHEELEIDGETRSAVVFNLTGRDSVEDRNVLLDYAGNCSGRPESRTCGDPEPIEFINTVQPDCCGTIYLEFRGCAELSTVEDDNSTLVIDCGFSLDEACVTERRLPDDDGRLPNEYDGECGHTSEPTTTTSTTPGPPIGFSHDPQSSLPWTDSFDDHDATDFVTVLGGFTLIPGGSTSGQGLAGELDILIPNSPATNLTVVFQDEHGLAVADTFVVLDNEVAGYNTVHSVVSLDAPNMLVSNVTYSSDGNGGIWLRDAGSAEPNVAGSWSGSIASIVQAAAPSDTKTRINFNQPHGLAVSSFLAVAGNSVSAYNTLHTVMEIISATAVRTNQTYSSAGTGGAYVKSVSGGGGLISTLSGDFATEKMVFTTLLANGLAAGAEIVVGGNSRSEANVKHVVTEVLSATTFLTDRLHEEDGSGGLWYRISGDASSGYGYLSDALGRNISLWTYGIPQQSDWESWFIEVETILSLRSGSLGLRHNGGLVLNYTAADSYFLAEVNWDNVKSLRLWSVQDGTFVLRGAQDLSVLALDRRYRLTARVVQYAPHDPAAYVTVSVQGLDDSLSAQLGPLRLAAYAPATGRVGLHSNQSSTRFDTFTVRDSGA